ncbi:MAG: DUF6505 family protein [Pseudomonadota bacterium]
MKLFKTIHFDQSDANVYEAVAGSDEWAVSGAFAFSNASPDTLSGKAKQAFSNGFLSLEGFGRATFVTIAQITRDEERALVDKLSQHFVDHYGAPDLRAAKPAAQAELEFARSTCAGEPVNTVFTVRRHFDDDGNIKEEYRIVTPPTETTHTKVWDIVEDE